MTVVRLCQVGDLCESIRESVRHDTGVKENRDESRDRALQGMVHWKLTGKELFHEF